MKMTNTLQKQWRFLSKPQERLLVEEGDDKSTNADTVIGYTFSGSNIEIPITRKDVLELMSGNYQGPMSFAPMEKHLAMVCDYVNQTYGDDPPYCVSLPVETGGHLVDNFGLKVFEALKARQVTATSFYATEYIFVPIPVDESVIGYSGHVTLLVISPRNKTIELLDSLGRDTGSEWHGSVYIKAFDFLATYLRDGFDAREWRMRSYHRRFSNDYQNDQSDEKGHEVDCQMSVLANAMAIAFGFSLPDPLVGRNWLSHVGAENVDLDEKENEPYLVKWFNRRLEVDEWWVQVKRKRVASELLHGGFEPWKDGYDEENPYDGIDKPEEVENPEDIYPDSSAEEEEEPKPVDFMDYSDERNPFAYQFGNYEYTKEGFSPLTEHPEIYGQLTAKDLNAKIVTEANGDTKIVISKSPINPRTAARKQRRRDRAALAAMGQQLGELFPNNAAQVASRMQKEPRYQALGNLMGVNDSVRAHELAKYITRRRG